jgi:putative phosphoesterase
MATAQHTVRVGLISDTHGLLRPEALDALRGSDHIIHAGDIGESQVLEQLATIAPVTMVRGNNDTADWCRRLPLTTELVIRDVHIHVVHDLGQLDRFLAAHSVDVVVSGHSHVPKIERKQGVLFVNPGSAGPRRFSLPVSIAKLVVVGREIAAEVVTLSLLPPVPAARR